MDKRDGNRKAQGETRINSAKYTAGSSSNLSSSQRIFVGTPSPDMHSTTSNSNPLRVIVMLPFIYVFYQISSHMILPYIDGQSLLMTLLVLAFILLGSYLCANGILFMVKKLLRRFKHQK